MKSINLILVCFAISFASLQDRFTPQFLQASSFLQTDEDATVQEFSHTVDVPVVAELTIHSDFEDDADLTETTLLQTEEDPSLLQTEEYPTVVSSTHNVEVPIKVGLSMHRGEVEHPEDEIVDEHEGHEDGELIDLLEGATATQSSDYGWVIVPEANLALDGNPDPDFEQQSCTHTNEEYQPWWKVDMGRTVHVATFSIVDREPNMERLVNFEVRVGDNEDFTLNDVCQEGLNYGQTDTPCGLDGRYMSIQLKNEDNGVLTLCEVDAMGYEIEV